MKRQGLFFCAAAMCIILNVLTGCVPKGYQQAVDQAVIYENQEQYEQAYQFYKQALELQPKDKALQAKLGALGRLISERYTGRAIKAYENKRYQTALDLLRKALVYDPANSRATTYTGKAMDRLARIKAMYSEADMAATQNKWLQAVGILNDIALSYKDDPDINKKIAEQKKRGYDYYMQNGLDARREGRYDVSFKRLESADQIMPGSESARELALAKNYLQAEKHYWQAREKVSQKDIIAAMDQLFLARNAVEDHESVNQLYKQLTPAWSALMVTTGNRYDAASRPDKAYEAFAKLYAVNPRYPDAKRRYLQSRASFLNFYYRNLVRAYNDNDFQLVNIYADNIINVEPLFLDTREIMTRALQKRFNRYYQKGLHYMAGNNDGKAILCFQSAETHLTETAMTQDLIKQSWDKIRRSSALNVAIWEFFNQIDDPGLSAFATVRLNDLIRQQNEQGGFKNIQFNADDIRSDKSAYRPDNMHWVDWGALTLAGYNAAISGDIKQLKLEKTVASEWKVRKRMVRRIVDNPDYARLEFRKAQLNQGLNSKKSIVPTSNEAYLDLVKKRDSTRAALNSGNLSKYKRSQLTRELVNLEKKIASTNENRPMRNSEIKKELEALTKKLAGTPQKIEKELDEETPYQVVRHVISARTRIELQISMPGGRKLWPVRLFEDELRVEDTVIPPNLNSNDPKEREGDPLSLPSDTQIKEQAVNAIIVNKIFPALLETLDNYGMRFYERARVNDQSPTEAGFPSVAFFNAIEDYYRFLACYKDKGQTDTLIEDVNRKLDGFINSHWLISGPKLPNALPPLRTDRSWFLGRELIKSVDRNRLFCHANHLRYPVKSIALLPIHILKAFLIITINH